MPEGSHLELHRVKSLREEQESKIAHFMREDKFRSEVESGGKGSPQKGKGYQSLSPKKTKRIERGRVFRLVQEAD